MNGAKQAIERAFPGLRCNRVESNSIYLWISVTGTAEDLIRNGIVIPMMLDLPPCGARHFSAHNRSSYPMPFSARVWRTKTGLFRVHRVWLTSDGDYARMHALIGAPERIEPFAVRVNPKYATRH